MTSKWNFFVLFLWLLANPLQNNKLKKVINRVLVLFLSQIYWTIFYFHSFFSSRVFKLQVLESLQVFHTNPMSVAIKNGSKRVLCCKCAHTRMCVYVMLRAVILINLSLLSEEITICGYFNWPFVQIYGGVHFCILF